MKQLLYPSRARAQQGTCPPAELGQVQTCHAPEMCLTSLLTFSASTPFAVNWETGTSRPWLRRPIWEVYLQVRWIAPCKCLISSFPLQREARGLTDSAVPPLRILNPTQGVWLRLCLLRSIWRVAHLAVSSKQAAKRIWKQSNPGSYRLCTQVKNPVETGSHAIPESFNTVLFSEYTSPCCSVLLDWWR